MSERKAFKDWFDDLAVDDLAVRLANAFPHFPRRRFVRTSMAGLYDLEMMDRVRQIAAAMEDALPSDLPSACRGLLEALPAGLEDGEQVTNGYVLWPVGQYLADQCRADLSRDEVEVALEFMEELTQRFTAEFAVRPYVEHHAEQTLAFLRSRVDHPSEHVRRWCSEGTRPRLPWGRKLKALEADPDPALEILEALRSDPERYVQRSVANHLNDIGKVHPERVVDLARRWWSNGDEATRWIVRHALRSLLKQGHSGALEVLGFGPPRDVDARLELEPEQVRIGGATRLRTRISSRAQDAQLLMVDFVVHYVKAAGSTSPKVFKWTQVELPAGGDLELEKRHVFRHVSIRRIHPGAHRVELQINGQVVAEACVEVAS